MPKKDDIDSDKASEASGSGEEEEYIVERVCDKRKDKKGNVNNF